MLTVSHDAGVATVRMDRPPVNALDLELLEALDAEIRALDDRPDVVAIVLTGNERAFSAGVDLPRILDGGEPYTTPFLHALSTAILTLFRTRTPTVAAVNGHAIAGGAILAAACDHTVAADDDRIRVGLSEMTVGVPFPAAAIEVVRYRMGERMRTPVLLAELVPPSEACELGLIDRTCPGEELLDVARAAARALATIPPATFALAKEQLHALAETMLDAHGKAWDARAVEGWSSAPVRATLSAFAERTLRR